MDQRPGNIGLPERVASLETAIAYERRLTDQHLSLHHQRISQLEGHQPHPVTSLERVLTAGGWIKILIAVCLPLLVLLATGDTGKALTIGRLLSGSG